MNPIAPIVWDARVAVVVLVTCGAALYVPFPAWLYSTVQVPLPLVIVIVTGEPGPVLLPLPLHDPLVVTATPRPEEACAATGNVAWYAAEAGAEVSTVIVWLVVPTVTLLLTGDAAL